MKVFFFNFFLTNKRSKQVLEYALKNPNQVGDVPTYTIVKHRAEQAHHPAKYVGL